MPNLCDPSHCTGCTACFLICPRNAIHMEADSEGFLHPAISEELCIQCGLCEAVCPVLNPLPENNFQTLAYAAICTQEDTRMQSTSGGVFTLLARWIFDHEGVVFGAVYDEDFSVHHCGITREEELQKVRTAKYSQSVLGDTFSQVRQLLKEGKYVLFSGTPCQVSGLQAYLQKTYEHLILVDVVCHGVPSPKVWQQYVSYRREHDAPDSNVQAINLRSKETGWPGYSVRFAYENGKVYNARNNEDPFLRGFVGNYYLRPSCYECTFKGISRTSDFTLADYWGVWDQLPKYNDGKGTSLVLLHSEKAKKILAEIKPAVRIEKVEAEKSVTENPSAVQPSKRPENRDAFWKQYENEDFETLITELLPPRDLAREPCFWRRCLRKVERFVAGR